jgi:hypothetical protein
MKHPASIQWIDNASSKARQGAPCVDVQRYFIPLGKLSFIWEFNFFLGRENVLFGVPGVMQKGGLFGSNLA